MKEIVIETIANYRDLINLLSSYAEYIVPEKRIEFEKTLAEDTKKLIENIGSKASADSNGGWRKIKKEWLKLKKKTERTLRKAELFRSSDQEELEHTLWYLSEQGTEADLINIRQVYLPKLNNKQKDFYKKQKIKTLFKTTEEKIEERVNDPKYVMRCGEETYQVNKTDWDEKYAGKYIAIHSGKIVGYDNDYSKLVRKVMRLQVQKGPLRAYIRRVGFPLPSYRRLSPRLKKKQIKGNEG